MPARIDILFQKFIDGTCTRKEYNELMDMLHENQQEERVKQMLQQIYQSTSGSLRSVTYVDTNGLLQSPVTETAVVEMTPPAGRKRRRTIMAAASILLLLFGGWWLLREKQNDNPSKNIVTESSVRKFTQRSEQKYLLLPDSTQVWLNAASSLEFPETFQTGKREVYLVGEAFFDVKHAENMPFLIHTGNVTTRVVGTAFNIKAYPDQPDVIVSVKRGKVQVSKNEKLVATLTVGQQVTVTAAAQQAAIQPTKESRVADWTTGQLSYTSRPLSDILKDLERNYNVTIELVSADLEQEIITTSFRRDIGVEEALDILCGLTDARLRKENGKYLISRKQH